MSGYGSVDDDTMDT